MKGIKYFKALFGKFSIKTKILILLVIIMVQFLSMLTVQYYFSAIIEKKVNIRADIEAVVSIINKATTLQEKFLKNADEDVLEEYNKNKKYINQYLLQSFSRDSQARFIKEITLYFNGFKKTAKQYKNSLMSRDTLINEFRELVAILNRRINIIEQNSALAMMEEKEFEQAQISLASSMRELTNIYRELIVLVFNLYATENKKFFAKELSKIKETTYKTKRNNVYSVAKACNDVSIYKETDVILKKSDKIVDKVDSIFLFWKNSKASQKELYSIVKKLTQYSIKLIGQSKEDIKREKTISKIILITILIIGFSIIIFISSILILSITMPTQNLIKSLLKVDKGNLDVVLELNTKDEFNDIKKHFNFMVKSLKKQRTNNLNLKNFLLNIIQSMPSALIVINQDENISQWNISATTLFNISRQEVVGKKLTDVLPVFEKFYKICKDVENRFTSKQFYNQSIFINNEQYFLDMYFSPIISDENKGVIIVINDITELKMKENQLNQAQKMETIGTLAGGLAHDFNNVLGGIVGSISMLKIKMRKNKQLDNKVIKEFSDTIEESGNRAVDLVKQLLTLSRKHELTFTQVDLNMSLKHVYKIATSSFDKSVEIMIEYTKEPALVNANPTQLEQVILNIFLNACHAMTVMRNPGEQIGGVLNVYLEKFQPDEPFLKSNPKSDEIPYWVLSIEDNGIGMTKTTISKIFEPFFTTKGKGMGTGLGLSMVNNIIQNHKGFIDVQSTLNVGTLFKIYLPVLLNPGNIKKDTGSKKNIKRGEGLILIIDDELHMRQIASVILEEFGYSVLLAENGHDGIEVYKSKKNQIKAVILDLVMPKLSGYDTFTQLRRINPSIKVLISSGFKKEKRIKDLIDKGAKGFLQKPYTAESLLNKLYEILNNKN